MNALIFHQSISNLQCELFSLSENSFTPESCRSLLLRSSSFREGFTDFRTKVRASADSLIRLHPANLHKNNKCTFLTASKQFIPQRKNKTFVNFLEMLYFIDPKVNLAIYLMTSIIPCIQTSYPGRKTDTQHHIICIAPVLRGLV